MAQSSAPRLPFWVLPAVICAVLAASALGASLWVHHIRNRPCIVLVNGNKLCGDDAVTWCEETADERQATQDAQAQFGAADPDDCDAILTG